jgi:hypothetical protein
MGEMKRFFQESRAYSDALDGSDFRCGIRIGF